MSTRSVVEFNHDYSHEIARDRDGFVDAVLAQLRSANDPATRDRLRRYGLVVVEAVHHSTDRKVVIMGKEYPL